MADYFAFFYAIGLILMALFIRFYLRKKKMKQLQKKFDEDQNS